MSIRRAAHRNRRNRGLGRRPRAASARRARLGTVTERLRVRKTVSAAEVLRSAGIPGQQGYVLQVISGSVHPGDKGLRCGDVVFGVCIGGFEKEVGGGGARPAATALASRTYPTGDGEIGRAS